MKRRYQQRRELAFSILGYACALCGSEVNLQIDHIHWQNKEFNFSKYWNCSEKKFLEELAKCQALCETCHREKSKVDIQELKLSRGGANQYGRY
jgi:5-methylcytosine-specific restriction endonuclease McrA